MYTIRHLIIDFIFVFMVVCGLELQATTPYSSDLSSIISKEICMDELFHTSSHLNLSVLRTTYIDNGIEINYEVIITPLGEAYILKDNQITVKSLSYSSGDFFSAKLKPGVLEIFKNSTLVYSQSVSNTVTYKSSSAMVEDKLYPVVMDYIDGYCGGVTKCAPKGWGNAGFVSKNVLKQSDEGSIRWSVQELDKYKMLGFGGHTTSKRYEDIQYAFYQSQDQIAIYESGHFKVSKPNFNLKIGDILYIKKESGQIRYFVNDELIYTSQVPISQDLYILGVAHTLGALIQNVEASFDDGNSSVPVTDSDFWETITGFCDQESTLVKCVSEGWDNGTYISKAKLMSTEDGDMSFNIVQIDKLQMIGLGGRSSAPSHYSDIEFALYIYSDKKVRVFENGTRKMLGPIVSAGEKLSIKKIGNQIKYYLNDAIIYTSSLQVNYDLYIMGTSYNQGCILPDISASFTEVHELYTTASVSKLTNQIKWNSLKNYSYNTTYKGITSTSKQPSALSENYYQSNLGHSPVTITADLSNLFTPENTNRDVTTMIGIKEFEEGNYLESSIAYTRMYSGFVFNRSRGEQKVFLLDGNRIEGEGPRYAEGDQYKIRLEGNLLKLIKESKGSDQVLFTKSLNPHKKYMVYQGSDDINNPFINVKVEGFETVDFVNYSYQYDGGDELLKVHNGDVKQILQVTGQSEIIHHMGWHNLKNVKNHTSQETVRGVIEQSDVSSNATGESAYRFNPTDAFKISFEYLGGEYSIGSKTLLESTLNPFLSGFSISGGSLSLVNNGNLSHSTPLQSGANISMIFSGNNTMILQLNGHSIGTPINLPASVLNMGVNLSQGSLPSVLNVTALSPSVSIVAPSINITSSIGQDTYNTTCNQAQMTMYVNSGGYYNSSPYFEIIEMNTFTIVDDFNINVTNPNTIYIHTLTNTLDIGTYAYRMNGNFVSMFEVLVPAEWDDDLTNPLVDDVIFDLNAYNTASQSFLMPVGSNAKSISKNTINLHKTFSIKIPINGTETVVELHSNSAVSRIFNMIPMNGGIQVNNQSGSSFMLNTTGDLILNYIYMGSGDYQEHIYFIPSGNPFNRELKTINNISFPSGDLKVFLRTLTGVIKYAGMTFCNENTIPSIVDETLIFANCGSDEFGDPIHPKAGYEPNNYSCPAFNLSFKIKGLAPLTNYNIRRNMFYYDVNTSSYKQVYNVTGTIVQLEEWWCVDATFTTDANGESTTFINLFKITSEHLFNNALYIRVNSASGPSHEEYIHLDYSIEEEAVNEVYRKCFNYNVKGYDCYSSRNGSIDNERNYDLAQPQTGFGEIDYEWVYTNQPVNGGLAYDLETGCYTVSIDYEASCGLPQKTLQYKMLARTDWQASSSGGVDYIVNSAFNTNQYKDSKLLLTGLGEIKSFNKAPIEYASIIRYRHLYPDFKRDIGFYLEGTASNDFAVLVHISTSNLTTGLSDVSLQIIENGVLQPLILTTIKLSKYQFLDLKIDDSPIQNKLKISLIQYDEFGQYPGDINEITEWEKLNINVPVNGGENYQAYVKHYDTGAKTPNLSVNFCVEPVEPYTALLQRNLHDGRHEVARCISETGNPNCPIPINGPCDPSLTYDILYFKFDEDYYRDIANVERLDFEIRDYKNNLHLSSINNLPNSIVKIGDNRYELSMTALNSIHPYYTLIVKNAKNEKRYLRFKK